MPNIVPISDAVRGLLHRYIPNQAETQNAATSSDSVNISSHVWSASPTASADAIHVTSSSVSTQCENEALRNERSNVIINGDAATKSQNGQRKPSGAANSELMQNQGGDSGYAELTTEQQQNTSSFASRKGISNRVHPNDRKSDSIFFGSENGGDDEREGFTCFKRKSFHVSIWLKNNWKTQASFFTKIMMAKSLQALIIIIWTYISIYYFAKSMEESNYTNIHCFVLFLYFITKLFIISCKGHCTNAEMVRGASYVAWLALGMAIEALCIGTMCASLILHYEIKTPLITIWILQLSYLLISVVPHLSHLSITKWTNAALEFMVVFLVSLIFIAFKAAETEKSYMQFFLVVWAPSAAIAEAIILGSFLWTREVIFGSLFHAHEKDWLFVAACI